MKHRMGEAAVRNPFVARFDVMKVVFGKGFVLSLAVHYMLYTAVKMHVICS